MLHKKNIFVLMGGRSSEYEISVLTGCEVARHLDTKKYDVFPIVITKDGRKWELISGKNVLKSKRVNEILQITDMKIARKEISISDLQRRKVDVVFIAMHGQFGEDGTVQGMLELASLRYTGSGVLASALGMDKIMFRKVLKHEGIKYPNYIVFRKKDRLPDVKNMLGKFPYFVKPHDQGSSVGISKVRYMKDLKKAIDLALGYSDTVLIEECIDGIEVTCAIFGNERPYALPLVEVQPIKRDFFDYQSKYSEGGADEIVPARISKNLTNKIQDIAVKVHKTVGCRGFSRVDFILKNRKAPYVLEINTIPGLTPTSLFPKAAKAHGFNYGKLLDTIIKYAYE